MDDYIARQELLNKFNQTKDVQKVVHGRWIGEYYECSNCGRYLSEITKSDSCFAENFYGTLYCPYCGAIMDEVSE